MYDQNFFGRSFKEFSRIHSMYSSCSFFIFKFIAFIKVLKLSQSLSFVLLALFQSFFVLSYHPLDCCRPRDILHCQEDSCFFGINLSMASTMAELSLFQFIWFAIGLISRNVSLNMLKPSGYFFNLPYYPIYTYTSKQFWVAYGCIRGGRT